MLRNLKGVFAQCVTARSIEPNEKLVLSFCAEFYFNQKRNHFIGNLVSC